MNDSKLDFWIKNDLNVLMEGERGVGKTARIIEAFNRNKLKWISFSASTLDPWVDFIGVPKEAVDSNGLKYLELVRPLVFATDSIEAIFLDEYNRAPKKVRNAVMELIQFKSINGKKFNNLKIVWAAINPDPDENDTSAAVYDVEPLDPAQRDRFHVFVKVPYKPDKRFFKEAYGENGLTAVDWWNDLPDKIKKEVSPRRLDYALHMNKIGGDIRDILPPSANVTKLVQELTGGSFKKNLLKVFSEKDRDKAKAFIKNPNNFDNCIDEICLDEDMMKFFLPHVEAEKISALMDKSKRVADYVERAIVEKEKGLVSSKSK